MKAQKTLDIIGIIRASEEGFVVSLDKKYAPGLKGLKGFSHAVILWWAHGVEGKDERKKLNVGKPYTNNPDDVGVFGSRSQARPNPVCMSVVPIHSIDTKEGTITVPYIDTFDQTPVIDIKPYYPASDRIKNVKVPEWCDHWPNWYEDSGEFDWEAEFAEPVYS